MISASKRRSWWQDDWSVGTTEYHGLGGERSTVRGFDLLDRPNGIVEIDGP